MRMCLLTDFAAVPLKRDRRYNGTWSEVAG